MPDLVKLTAPDGGPTIAFPAPLAGDARRFLASLPYGPRALLLDEVTLVDPAARRVEARLDTTKPLPFVDAQRGPDALHPRHVNGGVMGRGVFRAPGHGDQTAAWLRGAAAAGGEASSEDEA